MRGKNDIESRRVNGDPWSFRVVRLALWFPSLPRHRCAPAVRRVKNNVAADIYSDKAAREGEEGEG